MNRFVLEVWRWLSALWRVVSVRFARWFRFAPAFALIAPRPARVASRPAPHPRLCLSALAYAYPYIVGTPCSILTVNRGSASSLRIALLRFSLSAGLRRTHHRLASASLAVCLGSVVGFSGLALSRGKIYPLSLYQVGIYLVKYFLHYMEGKISFLLSCFSESLHFRAFREVLGRILGDLRRA